MLLFLYQKKKTFYKEVVMKIFLKLFLVSVLMFSVFACSDEAEEIVESITESTSSES